MARIWAKLRSQRSDWQRYTSLMTLGLSAVGGAADPIIMVDPLLAISAGVVLGLAYTGIFAAWRHSNRPARQAIQERPAVSEAFGAVKGKVGELEQAYVRRFVKPQKSTLEAKPLLVILTAALCVEAIAFGGMLLVVLSHGQKRWHCWALPIAHSMLLPVIASCPRFNRFMLVLLNCGMQAQRLMRCIRP